MSATPRRALPPTAPFLRQGAAVPLTAVDYAVRAQVSLHDAKSALQRLIYAGLVSSCRPRSNEPTIYELTADAGMVDRINRRAAA